MTLESGDTIVAIATASGNAAIGIVKLSGPRACEIGGLICGREIPPRQVMHLPFTAASGELVDRGIGIFFPAGQSYTGEPVFELQAHGNAMILDQLLAVAVSHGARPAEPGEFTRRAFLNDRIDLTQAEAINDLINSASIEASQAALRSLQGEFSSRVAEIVTAVTRVRVYVEAALDFAEEEIDFLADDELQRWLDQLVDLLHDTLRRSKQGSVLREGLTVVLAGAPNVGKSSILNRLTLQDSAIVTDVAGTTRDVLKERIVLNGMPLTIIDTAGLRDSDDPVEKEGIRRTRAQLHQADLVLLIQNAGEPVAASDVAVAQGIPLLRVYNKLDLVPEWHPADSNALLISALNGQGIDSLRDRLLQIAGFESTAEDVYMARRRHLEALKKCDEHVAEARRCLTELSAGELAAEELLLGHRQLQKITGEFSSDDLLGEIFSNFCIGK